MVSNHEYNIYIYQYNFLVRLCCYTNIQFEHKLLQSKYIYTDIYYSWFLFFLYIYTHTIQFNVKFGQFLFWILYFFGVYARSVQYLYTGSLPIYIYISLHSYEYYYHYYYCAAASKSDCFPSLLLLFIYFHLHTISGHMYMYTNIYIYDSRVEEQISNYRTIIDKKHSITQLNLKWKSWYMAHHSSAREMSIRI